MIELYWRCGESIGNLTAAGRTTFTIPASYSLTPSSDALTTRHQGVQKIHLDFVCFVFLGSGMVDSDRLHADPAGGFT